ncbi:hypothetical protein AACH06_18845 [Ideonella sp. DXS29W]|uniref:DUF3142 domain-containing protein n=1 Tax=Ideonella lacteola TaxID=2984193 RepID=A0ABU9BTU4_9BURK
MVRVTPLRLGLAALLVPLLLCLPGSRAQRQTHPALAALPPRMLWAWERPEDLRGLPPDIGVAWLARTIELDGRHALVRRRAPALEVSPGTVLVPVLHVDLIWRRPPRFSAEQRERVVQEGLDLQRSTGARVLQLDFEIGRSQRRFLAEVVGELRRRLPPEVALSMTALASWCAGDAWLGHSPADEIVPMAFRMASDDAEIRTLLARTGQFPRARCQSATGSATDEPMPPLRSPRRYYFSPRSWTAEQWQRLPAATTSH